MSACSRPRDTPTRERKSLNGLWRFALDADGAGRREGWWERSAGRGARDARPGQLQRPLRRRRGARPRRRRLVPDDRPRPGAAGRGERIVLRFDSATHRAVVWVDETQVAEHEGGYTPFEADITDVVEPGGGDPDHRRRRQRPHLAVDPARATSRRRPTGPASATSTTSSTTPACTGRSGCTRTPRVVRRATSRSSPASTARRAPSATRSRRPARRPSRSASPCATPTGAEVARATGASGELTVEDVHPWRPGEGYLYELAVELWGDGDGPVDVYSLPVGIRTVAWTARAS